MNDNLWGSLPPAASEAAHSWNELYYFLIGICAVFFVIVIVPMVFFAIKYRARPGVKASSIAHNTPLEILWTVLPTILVMIIFVWGWVAYEKLETKIPPDAMEVRVTAQSWAWNFQYDDGKTTTNQLFVPVGKAIKLLITSKQTDVLHSFFVPNFRIKKDAVPGMYNKTWFKADIVGQHQIFCAEYCGAGHSAMLAKVIVLDEERWKIWKWGGKIEMPPPVGIVSEDVVDEGQHTSLPPKNMTAALPPTGFQDIKLNSKVIEEGRSLIETRGCVSCHSSEKSSSKNPYGPSFYHLFGKKVILDNGENALVDENYLWESINEPHRKVVKGYENILMPSYAGQFTEDEMWAMISYIKSLN